MGLTADEKAKVLAQVPDPNCPQCGDVLEAWDDGMSPETEWGVSGAYVLCNSCGLEVHKWMQGP